MELQMDSKAFFALSYGVYVVGTAFEGRLNGQVANSAMQITGHPATVAVSLHRDNFTTELLEKSGLFSLSILDKTVTLPAMGPFGFRSGREVDKYSTCRYELGALGMPILLDNVVAALEARVISVTEVFTHKIFVGLVESARVLGDGEPLTYRDYHVIKKGKSPVNAPTHVFNEVK